MRVGEIDRTAAVERWRPVYVALLCVAVIGFLFIFIYLRRSDSTSMREPALTVRSSPLSLWDADRSEVDLPTDRMRYGLTRVARHDFSRWNQLTHGLRLWGPKIDRLGNWNGKRMLDVICSAEEAQAAFGFAPHLLNRNGLQFGHQFVEGNLQGEKHRDETISILGEIGIPSNRQIVVWDQTTTVAETVRAAAVNCDLNQELDFSVAVFAYYLPPQRTWTNKFGEEISFDILCDRLCDRPLGTGGCGGCHAMYSLAIVLSADRHHEILSEASRRKVRSTLAQAIHTLQETQREDGTWDLHWFDPKAPQERDLSTTTMATGHTLEWLAVAPPDIMNDPEMVSRGCEGALRLLMDAPQTLLDTEYNYYTHVANALKLWSPQSWRSAERDSRTNSQLESMTASENLRVDPNASFKRQLDIRIESVREKP